MKEASYNLEALQQQTIKQVIGILKFMGQERQLRIIKLKDKSFRFHFH